MSKKRLILAGAGTGGHFYPAMAVASEFRKRGWETLFIVKNRDICAETLKKGDWPYLEIDMSYMPRNINPLKHMSFYMKIVKAHNLMKKACEDYAPLAAVGFGSYVAFPVLTAAKSLGIPVFLHESNAKWGLANEICSRFADAVFLGLPAEGKKGILTGTPIRNSFSHLPSPVSAKRAFNLLDDPPVFTFTGGSQGARAINEAAVKAVGALKKSGADFQIIHIAGKRDYELVKTLYAGENLSGWRGLKVMDYCENMHEVYAASDLVFSRSGAGTLAELLHLKIPAALVPLPGSAGGHQFLNARILEKAGAAIIIRQNEKLAENMGKIMEKAIKSPSFLYNMRKNYEKINVPKMTEAAARMADYIESGVKAGRRKGPGTGDER